MQIHQLCHKNSSDKLVFCGVRAMSRKRSIRLVELCNIMLQNTFLNESGKVKTIVRSIYNVYNICIVKY